MKEKARYVLHNYFRAGFFATTVGIVAIVYGLVLLAWHGLTYWLGYLEIGIGGFCMYASYYLYLSYRYLEEARKKLKEIEHTIEMQEKGINYF